jgi:hypothetical protein
MVSVSDNGNDAKWIWRSAGRPSKMENGDRNRNGELHYSVLHCKVPGYLGTSRVNEK